MDANEKHVMITYRVLTWRHQRLCIFELYGATQILLLLLWKMFCTL